VPRTAPSALVVLAAGHGLFRAANLDVTLVPTDYGTDALALLQAGHADAAVSSDFVFVTGAFENPELRLVAAIDQSDATRCVVRADRGIAAPADLRGRRIGWGPGAATVYYVDLFLSMHGLGHDDVQRVPLTLAQIRNSFQDDLADVVFTWNTFAWELAAGPIPTTVLPAQGEYPLISVVSVTRTLAAQHPAALAAFVRALIAAEELAERNPQAAQATLAEWTGIPAGAIADTWQDNDLRVTLNRALMLGLEEIARWLIAHDRTPTTQVPNFLDFIAFEPLVANRPEAATIIR
jgi:NitT/TauT family transport system substrate-binding protein